jgi:hypothetical protein
MKTAAIAWSVVTPHVRELAGVDVLLGCARCPALTLSVVMNQRTGDLANG